MPHAIEVQTTVLPGHRVDVFSPELPEGSAATVRIAWDESRSAAPGRQRQVGATAERRYLQDLPALLDVKAGRWVAYTTRGLLAEGDDELALFRICQEQGLKHGEFIVARVEPDLPASEVTVCSTHPCPCQNS
jgi:hypothetical protein